MDPCMQARRMLRWHARRLLPVLLTSSSGGSSGSSRTAAQWRQAHLPLPRVAQLALLPQLVVGHRHLVGSRGVSSGSNARAQRAAEEHGARCSSAGPTAAPNALGRRPQPRHQQSPLHTLSQTRTCGPSRCACSMPLLPLASNVWCLVCTPLLCCWPPWPARRAAHKCIRSSAPSRHAARQQAGPTQQQQQPAHL